MNTLYYNFNLKTYNSFNISCEAKLFAQFSTTNELQSILERQKELPLILGGGSNVLFIKNFEGLVLKNNITGIDVLKQDADFVYVKVGAGENWHQFVHYCIDNDFAGVENLSLIPGNVGACPIQNIGAYGVEVKEVISSVEGYFLTDGQPFHFSNAQCHFGYRDSIFKQELKNKFVITYVTFKLLKKPNFNSSYGAIQQELEKMKISSLSLKAISQAVINIRSSKLPNIAEIGNAGSFFKNPEVDANTFNYLKTKHPNLVAFALPNSNFKLAAGWLIEYCGFKGYRIGDAGCYPKQALVLVNYGQATGKEIYNLSQQIIDAVNKEFNVVLEREVNII